MTKYIVGIETGFDVRSVYVYADSKEEAEEKAWRYIRNDFEYVLSVHIAK